MVSNGKCLAVDEILAERMLSDLPKEQSTQEEEKRFLLRVRYQVEKRSE